MRTKFFAIAALVLGLASCQRDFAPEGNVGGEVDFRLEVSAPELGATRADADAYAGHDSAYGAIDYLSDAEWAEVDLRYILEVYDVEADYTNATPIKDRQVIIVDKYEPVKFEVRLAPQRDYHFVVFADFVAQGATNVPTVNEQAEIGLRHNIGATLGDITIKADAINDELADAYFATLDYTPNNNVKNTAEPIVLRRPYGKVRVVATDLNELNLNVEPRAVRVAYNAYHANAFNAVNGKISGEYVKEFYDYGYADLYKNVEDGGLSEHLYTEGYDAMTAESNTGVERHTHMTLFTDYILAENVQSAIQFTMSVYDVAVENIEGAQPIKTTAFNTQIPVQRNYLTTIIGNVLTTATDINVSIDDNFATELNEEGVNLKERILLETLINGGKFVLTEDLTLTAPHYLEGTIECAADAVIDLNGHTLKYEIPSDVENDSRYAIFVRVLDKASLTFVGEGNVVSDGYIASVNEGGVLTVSEGLFETNSCTVFQSNGGKINIFGGEFKAAPYNGDHRYTINFVDNKKQDGLIEISGGRFYKYNPSESHSEAPAMDFCANGFWGVADGDWYEVVAQKHVELYANYAKVWSAEGLIQWAYIVNNGATAALRALDGFDENTFDKNAYGLKVMANIQLPARAFTVDAATETYVYTDEVITVENGIPSASNWPTLSDYETANQVYYGGAIQGNGHTINGLRINQDLVASGFLCWTKGASVDNLTFSDAIVYNKGGNLGESYTGIVIGRCWNGSYVYNTHIKNSSVYGHTEVGAVVGRVYHRTQLASGEWKNEKMAYVVECSTDENTTVEGDHNIGGIVGMNYGCVIGNCVSNATVIGRTQVGGIVGSHRSYYRYADGYVIGCVSTDKALVKATNGYAGGIAGYTNRDNSSHINTRGWIIGCTSLAQVNAKDAASFIGNCVKNNGAYGNCIAASYAVTNLTDFAKGSAKPQIEAAYNVTNVSEFTQAHVDAMNAAIEAFNVSPDNIYVNGETGAVMYKRWVLTADGPVLQ